MKKILCAALAGCLMVSMAACGAQMIGGVQMDNLKVAMAEYPESLDYEDYERRGAVREENKLDQGFLIPFNGFAAKTTAKLFMSEDENKLYSPLSLYYALGLAAEGANGSTADELCDLLGVADRAEFSAEMGKLFRLLYEDSEHLKLKLANSIWLDDEADGTEYTFNKEWLKMAVDDFYSSVFSVDFADSEAAKSAMSAWIKEATNDVLDYSGEPDPSQVLSIINTVYFKDQWTTPFGKEFTTDGQFTKADGSTVPCRFMNTESIGRFSANEKYTLASIDLLGADGMYFILPKEGVSVDEILADPEIFETIISDSGSSYGFVTWSVPKFKYGTSMDLGDSLKALGVKTAFTDMADFSAMVDQPVFLSSAVQNTHIAIDENGVEAAAYTELGFCGTSLPSDTAEMILDRPFIYTIMTNEGIPAFIGVVGNPAE